MPAEPYIEILENFAEAALSNNPSLLIAPGEDAVHQLMLTNAAYYSAWKDMPVELPLNAAVYEEALKEKCSEEERYVSDESGIPEQDRKYIKK